MYKTVKIGRNNFVIRNECCLKMLDNPHRVTSKKEKRIRIAFTTEQISCLEKQFRKFPYISNLNRKEVAAALDIPEKAIKVWFQNRRMKEKKECINKEINDETSRRLRTEFLKQQINQTDTSSSLNQQQRSLISCVNINKAYYDHNTVGSDASSSLIFNAEPPVKKTPETIKHNASTDFHINQSKLSQHATSEAVFMKPPSITKHRNNKNIKNSKLINNNNKIEQIIPEDLSLSHKVNVPVGNQIRGSNNISKDQIYFSVIPDVPTHLQPCYSAGVLWNPVKFVPALPTTATSQKVAKNCCACDCHEKPSLASNSQQQSTTPRYILTAIPYQC